VTNPVFPRPDSLAPPALFPIKAGA